MATDKDKENVSKYQENAVSFHTTHRNSVYIDHILFSAYWQPRAIMSSITSSAKIQQHINEATYFDYVTISNKNIASLADTRISKSS